MTTGVEVDFVMNAGYCGSRSLGSNRSEHQDARRDFFGTEQQCGEYYFSCSFYHSSCARLQKDATEAY